MTSERTTTGAEETPKRDDTGSTQESPPKVSHLVLRTLEGGQEIITISDDRRAPGGCSEDDS